MKHIDLFKNIQLATKPRIIKASPKSDMAIIWFDIWDNQNGSIAKLLINYSFNLGQHIATVRATNMNLGVPQYYNCWKWGHSTFSCRVYGMQCQKCSSPHKLEHHRELAWCCKANPKLNPPYSKLARAYPALILSNVSIAKENTWLMTTSVPSRETNSTETGTQKKPRKPGKPGLIQFA